MEEKDYSTGVYGILLFGILIPYSIGFPEKIYLSIIITGICALLAYYIGFRFLQFLKNNKKMNLKKFGAGHVYVILMTVLVLSHATAVDLLNGQ